MSLEIPWHEQDDFWGAVDSILFNERRLSDAPAEVEQAVALLGVEPGAQVLDLCCGVGRHTLELARRGFRVTAVDRTRAYLEKATQQAQAEGLDIRFVEEDMRCFRQPEAFDAAINLFTSFGYFEDPADDRQVVENVYQSLKPGGAFLLEMMGKEVLARIFQERGWHEEDGLLVLEEREVCDGWTWIENRWILLRDGERKDLHLGHRLYSAAELMALLRESGFVQGQAYGSLDGSPYDHTARRLAVVARKAT